MYPLPRHLLLLSTLVLSACDPSPTLDFSRAEPGEALSGGATTVMRSDVNAFSLPSANLAPSRRLDFSVGNSFFRNPWVIAPASTTARDGLGPLFNTNACQNCHIKDGRGHPPAPGASHAVSLLVRLSLPAQRRAAGQRAQIRRRARTHLRRPVAGHGDSRRDARRPGAHRVHLPHRALRRRPAKSSCASRAWTSTGSATARCTRTRCSPPASRRR